jgi:hypothetical protein
MSPFSYYLILKLNIIIAFLLTIGTLTAVLSLFVIIPGLNKEYDPEVVKVIKHAIYFFLLGTLLCLIAAMLPTTQQMFRILKV